MGRTACTEPQCLYKGALYLFFTHQHNLMATAWSHIRQETAGFTAVTRLVAVCVGTDIAPAQNSCSKRDISRNLINFK